MMTPIITSLSELPRETLSKRIMLIAYRATIDTAISHHEIRMRTV